MFAQQARRDDRAYEARRRPQEFFGKKNERATANIQACWMPTASREEHRFKALGCGQAWMNNRNIETNAINTGQGEIGNEMAGNLEVPILVSRLAVNVVRSVMTENRRNG